MAGYLRHITCDRGGFRDPLHCHFVPITVAVGGSSACPKTQFPGGAKLKSSYIHSQKDTVGLILFTVPPQKFLANPSQKTARPLPQKICLRNRIGSADRLRRYPSLGPFGWRSERHGRSPGPGCLGSLGFNRRLASLSIAVLSATQSTR